MVRLTLTVLGGFQARLGSAPPVTLSTRKTQVLLAYLALPPGRQHSRDEVAALLWGDLSRRGARDSLRQALFALRRAVEPVRPACLCVEGATIALNADAVDVDAMRFERLVNARTREALEQAVELYRGDLLAGLTLQESPFEEWLMAERERLHELAIEAHAAVLAAQRAAGAVGAALQTGLRLIALDPLQEPVHRTLMRLYDQLGRRGSALHQYQLCVGVLQRELGVEPEEETKQLYQEILRRRLSIKAPPSEPVTSGGSPPFATIRRRNLILANDTPLIGRDREMARMRAALAEAVSGQGQVVAVAGEAGVGKTRLVAELAAELPKVGGRVLIGRGHESEQILPFGPWVDALSAGLELVSDAWLEALPLAMRRELGRLLPELEPRDDESAAPPDYLKLFEGVGLLFGHVATRQATILVLEDLHWSDEMSVRLLAFISRRLQAWRLLLIVTAREDALVDVPVLQRALAELECEPHVAILALRPLSRGDTVGLVRALSRPGTDEGAMARLSEQVWRTSEGNPLVVIEAMRAAALSPGLEVLPLPDRVREVVTRRLDRLSMRSRQLVAVASVVGREFEFALVQRAAGLEEHEAAEAVEELVRRHLLQAVGDRFDFNHDRIRTAVYDQLLQPRRALCHRQVADALEELYAGNLEPHALTLGTHYRRGQVWDKALRYLRQAGTQAVARSANREAMAIFEQALVMLEHLPQGPETAPLAIDLRLNLYESLRPLGDLAKLFGILADAESLARALSDQKRLGQVWAMTQYFRMAGNPEHAIETSSRALAVAAALGDPTLEVDTNYGLGRAYLLRGDYRPAVERFRRNLHLLEGGRIPPASGIAEAYSIRSRVQLVLCHTKLGEMGPAIAAAEEAIRLVEAIGEPKPELPVVAHWSLGVACLAKGDLGRAIATLEHSYRLCCHRELPGSLAAAEAYLGRAYALAGRLDEAVPLLGEAVWHAPVSLMYQRPRNLVYLGEAFLLAERPDHARSTAEHALHLCRVHRQRGFEAETLHVLGKIHSNLAPPELVQAGSFHREALALASELGERPLVAHCHLGLAKLYRRTDKRAQTIEHLTTATTMYREMDMRFWLERAEAEMHLAPSVHRARVDGLT